MDVQDAWMCRMRGCAGSVDVWIHVSMRLCDSLCGYIHREMAMKLKARTCI